MINLIIFYLCSIDCKLNPQSDPIYQKPFSKSQDNSNFRDSNQNISRKSINEESSPGNYSKDNKNNEKDYSTKNTKNEKIGTSNNKKYENSDIENRSSDMSQDLKTLNPLAKQDWKHIQKSENDQNFNDFINYEKYREPQPINERIYDEILNFSNGIDLKFTNMSATSKVDGYIKLFSSSKIFAFKTDEDCTAYLNLVSTTKNFHPQFRIYEREENRFNLLQNVNFNNQFLFSRNGFYVLEIGTDGDIDTTPFENIKYGGFQVIISSHRKKIELLLNNDQIKVSVSGYEGYVTFTHNADLALFDTFSNHISHGICNYQITPFYDLEGKILSIYFNKGSMQKIGQIMRATTIEITCNNAISHSRIFYGEAILPGMYRIKVESKRVCDLFDLIR